MILRDWNSIGRSVTPQDMMAHLTVKIPNSKRRSNDFQKLVVVLQLVAVLLTGSLMFLPDGAHAADGIGFAQAEEGTWYCRGGNPVATLNCARKKCQSASGGQECLRTKWCFRAGWSGLMTVNLSDFHNTEIVCGAPSPAAVRAVLEAFCAGNEYAASCSIFLLIDPLGNEQPEPGTRIPGPKAN